MPSERGIAAFQLPGVVTTTVELFERVWAGAAPLNPSALPESTELTPRERHLLSLLFSGSTDESAAAQLDISVRTVRRTVADIMNRLGARSRFQAGAKAAERGWLLDLAG
jgi:DNA-binding NarL/FixJ family response regulator